MKKQEQLTFLHKLFSSVNLTIVLAVILVFFLVSLSRQSIKYFSIKKEINNLEKEIKNLEEENLELTSSIEYFESDFYKEKEAREKMGLKKPDEKVIMIMAPKESAVAQEQKIKMSIPNLSKWWNYFFK